MNNKEVPVWEKANLTIDEAALYTGIGRNKLRQITDDDRCPFVLWVGNKRLLKRKKMDEYFEKAFSI
ncbi:MAG: excisionase family DNA-binding protein [Clostridiales bacterium]|nr:excisionase family DNA-binding protein [Clostridiales bacterium]